MRKHFVLAAVLCASAISIACEVEVGSRPTNHPAMGAPAAKPATPAPAPTPTPGAKRPNLGRAKNPGSNPIPVPAATPSTAPSTPPPATNGVLVGTNVFGTGTADPNGWKGNFYSLPAGTSKLPDLTTMTPTGVLFASTLAVTPKPMTGGFPGIDATKNENFALQFEAPLVVDTEGDYNFRLVSDDGAQLWIDGTPIVDNDGLAPNNTPKEKSGPVHLVKATHAIVVDYFQATGNVALQLFCTKPGGAEAVCPTHL